jgi:hypothetical protein
VTRRKALTLPLALVPAAEAQGISDEQARLWREFEAAWNPFAEDMNNGLFNTKRWAVVKKAFKHLGGCDK